MKSLFLLAALFMATISSASAACVDSYGKGVTLHFDGKNLKMKFESPAIRGETLSYSGESGGKMYFRKSGSQVRPTIIDATVFSHGQGKINYCKPLGNKGSCRTYIFQCN